MNHDLNEVLSGAGVIILLILLLNPLGLYMPSMTTMVVVSAVTLLALLWLGLIWRERPQDEREELHRLRASRAAFLVGSMALLAAALWQAATVGKIDRWLIATLGLMVLAKLVAQRNSRLKH